MENINVSRGAIDHQKHKTINLLRNLLEAISSGQVEVVERYDIATSKGHLGMTIITKAREYEMPSLRQN